MVVLSFISILIVFSFSVFQIFIREYKSGHTPWFEKSVRYHGWKFIMPWIFHFLRDFICSLFYFDSLNETVLFFFGFIPKRVWKYILLDWIGFDVRNRICFYCILFVFFRWWYCGIVFIFLKVFKIEWECIFNLIIVVVFHI